MSPYRGTATLSLALLLLLGVIAGEAEAGRRGRTQNHPLVATRSDEAAGTVKVRENRRRTTIQIGLRGLEPRKAYEVRDGATQQRLGAVETNRRGRARLKLTSARDGGSALVATDLSELESVEVVEEWTGDPVLEGNWKVTKEVLSFGFEAYGGDGVYAGITMVEVPAQSIENLSVVLDLRQEDGTWRLYDYASTVDGGLPAGATRLEDLARRKFEIVDGTGAVLVAGKLPELLLEGEQEVWEPEGELMPPPVRGTEPSEYLLRIARDDGALIDVFRLRAVLPSDPAAAR